MPIPPGIQAIRIVLIVFGIIFMLPGCIGGGIGAWWGISNLTWKSGKAVTTGTVTDLTGSDFFYATFTFTAADGQTVSVKETTGTRPARHAIGDTAPVLYDPANPSDAAIDEAWMFFGPLMLLGMSTLNLIIGLLLAVVAPMLIKRAYRSKPG